MKLFLAMLLLGTLGCWAQDLPQAPMPQKRPPKPLPALDTYLVRSDMVLRSLDAYTSIRLFNDPCKCFHEVNPIGPKTSNPAAIMAFQAGAGFAIIQGSAWLRHKGHPKWARALLTADVASESIAVANNFWVGTMDRPVQMQPIPSKGR